MPRPVRRLLSAITLAVILGASGALTLPAAALATTAASVEVPIAIAPAEGTFLEPGTVVLEWTAVGAADGYEVTWATDAGDDAGTATTSGTSLGVEVDSGSFVWQVRALPDGTWSVPATFHADPELPTLALPEEPAAAPVVARPGLDAVPGGVWIGGALGFSAVFLLAVVLQSRVRREQDA